MSSAMIGAMTAAVAAALARFLCVSIFLSFSSPSGLS